MVVLAVAALHANAAMVRVVAIQDGRTITIERGGMRETVRLAGVEISDEAKARELLRWTASDAWVMLEPADGGAFLVYRSPDALLLNRELVVRGYARATLASLEPALRAPSRYLGEFNPPVSESRPRQIRSDTSRRSTGPPSQSAGSRGRGSRRASRRAR